MKRFDVMEKFYSSKALLKMAGGREGDAPPTPSLLDLPLVDSFCSCNKLKICVASVGIPYKNFS